MAESVKYYLAVDIGASSGRHILGWMQDGWLQTKEVYRFPNGMVQQDGHLIWDIEELLGHVKRGIKRAKAAVGGDRTEDMPELAAGVIESLSVDTWGVDYILLKGDETVYPCYAYRDSRTEASIPEVHKRIPFADLYRRTGIQFATFNTIYQLYEDKMAGRLDGVTDFLMMPSYLMYRLTGRKAHEYTNSTTTGMVSAETGEYDMEIVDALGLPRHLFPVPEAPGTLLGEYEGIKVVLCATHDTGSAVEGIPMKEDAPYISSGTWSLLGVKTPAPITNEGSMEANWSNEGGVGYTRYQKNIMGMWVANELRRELCPDTSFPDIVRMAEESSFDETVDVNGEAFMAPESMKAAFDAALSDKPETAGDYFRCAYRSLALCYKAAIEELERNTGRSYDSIYIVGGGAKNAFVNRLTEEATGKKVEALPLEATALGNLKIQMEGK